MKARRSESDRLEAARYLNENEDLRRAVGAVGGERLDPHHLGFGEHNKNFWFGTESGERFVLRINVVPQPFHIDQVGYEFSALSALEPSGCTPRPVYLDKSKALIDAGAMVIGFCEGEELDFDNLRDGDLRCAVQLMAECHAVEVPDACPLHRPADAAAELYAECLERFRIYRSAGIDDARLGRWVERFCAAARRKLDAAGPPDAMARIINTETLPSHFLIPLQSAREAAANVAPSGRFCAHPGSFVDWERPILGEVAQDLAFFVSPATTFWDSGFLFPAAGIDGLVADYWRAVDGRFERGSFDVRFGAYLALSALRAVSWCCRALALRKQDPGMFMSEKAQEKLPVYLSDDFLVLLMDECCS